MRHMEEIFGHGKDNLIALATLAQEEGEPVRPAVRTLDAIYEDGAFYAVTYRNTNKMRQIARSPQVAAFAAWYDTANNEQDENCRILAIRLGRGTLNVNHWEKLYHMDFANRCMVDEP